MRALKWIAVLLGGVLLLGVLAGLRAWNDRPAIDDAGLDPAPQAAGAPDGGVHVTWLGVTTLLFDDGATRILIDGFFSRPGPLAVVLDRPVAPDLPGIDAALAAAGVQELAAVVPVHSHYDHAMDTGEVAKRTGAVVVGSSSTANAARGAGLPEDRIIDLTAGGRRSFGSFTLTLIPSRHAPIGDSGAPPFPGLIDAPLAPPAPPSQWKEGASYSIVLDHPSGSALVQGSAGFVEGALEGVSAQAVFLGIGGLAGLGEDYARRYWQQIVGLTGARRVFPVHWDDFTRPYGEIVAFPRALDDPLRGLGWMRAWASEGAADARVSLERLRFGEPVRLFERP